MPNHSFAPGDKPYLLRRPGRARTNLLRESACAFTVLFISRIVQGDGMVAWVSAGIFATLALGLIVRSFLNASTLSLCPDGFTVRSRLRKSHTVSWESVGRFRPASVSRRAAKMVVFDRSGAPNPCLRRVNPVYFGATDGLPHTYGLEAGALADLMNAWRDHWIFATPGVSILRQQQASLVSPGYQESELAAAQVHPHIDTLRLVNRG